MGLELKQLGGAAVISRLLVDQAIAKVMMIIIKVVLISNSD